ncbi:hypothetical protein KOI35_06465 [Actinoplanes bogorensis]|uniref:Uncharacterized protein n=1 Tax=Paractinoplanes bogorensis TaxID=1610840 RepID=A0ABS5YI48_9ACTN|nr:hypothetical protein [Actinoplanes bogorensis]MBU2663149.1 hypothetical protein [Actinoplanes bogorensis]
MSPLTRPKRWWLGGIVAAWIVVVAVLAVWSVGHEKATVPEQRDIALAVPDLQRAAGVVYAAAGGEGRAVVLGGLEPLKRCSVTPVRSGLGAFRNVTVHVPEGEAQEVAAAIADALPAAWEADVWDGRGGTRVSFHADAGDFIGVDMSTESTARTFSLRLSTGCRPVDGDETPARDDPATAQAPVAPAVLADTLGALGIQWRAPKVQAVTCPSGAVAASYSVGPVSRTKDLATGLRTVADGAEIVRDDDSEHAYRKDGDSIVIVPDGASVRVTVSTPCQ